MPNDATPQHALLAYSNAAPAPAPLAYTIDAAVRASGTGRSRLYEAIRDGSLLAVKNGTRTLILAEDLAAWVRSFPKLTPGEQKSPRRRLPSDQTSQVAA